MTSLPFIGRVKLLCRVFAKSVALNRDRSYEVRLLPSLIQKGNRPSSRLSAIKLSAAVAPPRPFAAADRPRWGNHGGGPVIEHTRSNLG